MVIRSIAPKTAKPVLRGRRLTCLPGVRCAARELDESSAHKTNVYYGIFGAVFFTNKCALTAHNGCARARGESVPATRDENFWLWTRLASRIDIVFVSLLQCVCPRQGAKRARGGDTQKCCICWWCAPFIRMCVRDLALLHNAWGWMEYAFDGNLYGGEHTFIYGQYG